MKLLVTQVLLLLLTLFVGACYPYGNPYTVAPNSYYCTQTEVEGAIDLEANHQLATQGQAELSLQTASARLTGQGHWSRIAPYQFELIFTDESPSQSSKDTLDRSGQQPNLTISIPLSITTRALYFDEGDLKGLEVVSSTYPVGCLQAGSTFLRRLPQ